jgi:hypothetical protein
MPVIRALDQTDDYPELGHFFGVACTDQACCTSDITIYLTDLAAKAAMKVLNVLSSS